MDPEISLTAPAKRPSLRVMLRSLPRLLEAAVAGFLVATAQAAFTPSINSVSIGSSEFVIDSDASRGGSSFERDLIEVDTNVTFTGTGSGNFRYDYQLLDEDDNLVLLDNGSGGTTTTFQGATFTIGGAVSKIESESFAPAEQLELYKDYRVRLLVKEQSPPLILYITKTQGDSSGQQFIHFTNTDPADAEVNVRGYIEDIRWTETWACDTDLLNSTFQAEADLKLFRYDDYLAASPDTDTIPYELVFELRESSTGNVVALVNNPAGPGLSMDEFHHTGLAQEPYELSFTRSFSVNPDAQLDPVNETYYLTISLTHEEESGQPYVTDQASVEGPAGTLLHFNGQLTAGGDTVIMTSIGNDPSAGYSNDSTHLSTSTEVTTGYVDTLVTYTLSGSGALDIELYPDGHAELVDATGTLTITAPSMPDEGSINNVRFLRSDLAFASNGLSSTLRVILPAGMGVYEGNPIQPSNHVLESLIHSGTRLLDQSLEPTAILINLTPATAGDVFHIIEETKPFEVVANSLLWNLNTGQFAAGITPAGVDRIRYVRKFEMDSLDIPAAGFTSAEKLVHSNELYFRHVATPAASAPVWTADANNTAQLDVTLNFNAGEFDTHFPHGVKLKWNTGGALEVDDDLIVPGTSSLPTTDDIAMNFARDCPEVEEAGCGTIGEATVVMDPGANSLQFTRDGGIDAAGLYINAASRRDVVMGYIDALSTSTNIYAHDSTTFDNARFLMAGHFLSGVDYAGSGNQAPGRLLNSGYDPTDLDVPERPESAAYEAGLGDYPGMNYRVVDEASAVTCISVLGGTPTPTYTLNDRSKFYTRPGGVSGILEPTANPFTSPIFIYGYEFTFTDYGLSFLNSEVHDSITAGSLFIPSPSNFDLDFDPLFFSCLGGLTTAEIDGGTFDDTLEYWNADFTGIAANFQPAIGAECDPSDAYLTLGVEAWASNISTPLSGTLGFKPDGNLITADDGLLESVDSRLGLPTLIDIAGPNDEIYSFYPAHDAYYENHDHSSEEPGRLNFTGFLDVAFFEDLAVHFQTGATFDDNLTEIHMMGGWTGDGQIDASTFDLDHYSYPSSDTLTNYRDGTQPDYLIHAQQDWLGVVGFDYPLSWSTTTRSFRATEPISNDLLVLTTEHELTYLSAENAELDFGANVRLDIPEINLSNIGVNLTEDDGVLAALQASLTGAVTDALLNGVDASAEILNDRMDEFYDRLFEATIDPLVDDLYLALDAAPDLPAMEAEVENYLCLNSDSVLTRLEDFDGAVGQAGSIIDEVDQALAKLQVAIRTVIGRVHVDDITGEIVLDDPTLTVPEDYVVMAGTTLTEGIFADADGDGYDIAEILLVALIEELSPEIADNLSAVLTDIAGSLVDQLEDELNAQFDDAGPTLDQLKSVLLEIHNAISEVRSAGNLYGELTDELLVASAAIQNLVTDAKTEINEFLGDIDFNEYSAEEVKEVIRTAIRDKFNASPVIADLQEVLKSYVYDLDAAMNEAVSSAFAEINSIINRLLDDAIPADSALAGLLDDAADISAAGSIDGFATINGDALRTLRLDAALQLKLPDDFEFAGFVEINQLDSFGDDSCSFGGEGEYAAEVIMGATDVPVAWIGDDLRFDVSTKFTFDTMSGFALRGFGGAVEMTEGEIGFESMAITSLGAAAMFGKDENYVAAEVGLAFDSYELAGGVFFGRTCSIDPLELVDPDVTQVLGDPPFTGIYAYGEAQIPIINASCLFSISAKAGVGVFWFEEGNTFGGKMLVGATGKALCAVEIGGEVVLVGSKSGNNYSFFGKGTIFGEVGVCPLCTTFNESVSLTYKNDKWSYDF